MSEIKTDFRLTALEGITQMDLFESRSARTESEAGYPTVKDMRVASR